MNDDRFVALALSLTDGVPVDWDSACAGCSPEERSIAERLRELEAVARMHLTAHGVDFTVRQWESVLPGTSWGPLHVRELIGSGAYGHVYRAHDPRIGRDVALKLLRGDSRCLAADTRIHEAHLLGRVRHQNVVTVYGADSIAGHTGIWMELITGCTLAERVAQTGTLPAPDAIRYGIAIADGLAAIHAAGLLHRDLKAQNVMIDASGRCVLMDLGAGGENSGTMESLVGTPAYLAPEVLAGSQPDQSSDIYASGVLLFHLLTGRFPLEGRGLAEIRTAHREDRRASLSVLRPDILPAIVQAVDRALAEEPAVRYNSATEMAAALRAIATGTGASDAEEPTRNRWRHLRTIVAALLLALTAPPLLVNSAPGALPFTAREWVLLTDIDNRTGDQLLDGTLRVALERELAASRFVNVVPRERIDDTLRLMQKPIDARIDTALGREIAIRDGGVRAVVTGQIDRIDNRYTLALQVVRPADGALAASLSEDVPTPADLLVSARRMSLAMRQQVGETLVPIDSSRSELQKVTTPSLRALHLYSQAAALTRLDGPSPHPGAAEQLLLESVKHDPGFASAYVLLAYVAHLQRRPLAEVLAHADRALALAGSVTEVERLFINAFTLKFRALQKRNAAEATRLHERAAATYEALLRLQPDHYWALERLAWTYETLRKDAAAAQIHLRLAGARPNTGIWPALAAWALFRSGQVDAARQMARRAAATATSADVQAEPSFVVGIRLLPAHEAWVRRDAPGALRATDEAAARWESEGPELKTELGTQLTYMYLALGRSKQAEQVARRMPPGEMRVWTTALVLSNRGDTRALRRTLSGLSQDQVRRIPGLLLEAGLLDRVRVWIEQFPGSPPRGLLGRLALAEGRLEEACRYLREATAAYTPPAMRIGPYLTNTTRYSQALSARGDAANAIAVLETASAMPLTELAHPWAAGAEWLHLRAQLADLYRSAGRFDQAEAVETELLDLLAVADDDHLIKDRLLKRRTARQGDR